MPEDINPYLWCSYVDSQAVIGYEIEYDAAYHRPDIFVRVGFPGDVYVRETH